jgi:flagellum-specific ATP synthase
MYAVLVEGDDMNDPIADSVRAIIDGHIVLSRDLAMQNHYPAVDVLQSISRIMIDIVEDKHLSASRKFIEILDIYKRSEDLIKIGAYVKGSNKDTDYAIEMIDPVKSFLRQGIRQKVNLEECVAEMKEVLVDKDNISN